MPRYSPETDARLFWERVNRGPDCWLWTGATTNSNGYLYGVLRRHRRWQRAHRYAYELAVGPIPEGMLVCHACDVPLCVRPDHLFLGTHRDNTQDMLRKRRHGRERVHGSAHHKAKLTESDVQEIRRKRADGAALGPLASEYGVSKGLIWQIVSRRIWTHVA